MAALALRDLGGGRIATTMIAPNPEFVYRWSPPTKIAAKYLAPYLQARERLATSAR